MRRCDPSASRRVDSPLDRDYSARALSQADGFLGHPLREMDSYSRRGSGDRKHLRMPLSYNPISARDRLRTAFVFLE